MGRSLKKGPFADEHLMKKVRELNEKNEKPLKLLLVVSKACLLLVAQDPLALAHLGMMRTPRMLVMKMVVIAIVLTIRPKGINLNPLRLLL